MRPAARSRARRRSRTRTRTHLLLLGVSAALGGSVAMRMGAERRPCCAAARVDGPFLAREVAGAVETVGPARTFRRGQRVAWVVWIGPASGGPFSVTAMLRPGVGEAALAWSSRLGGEDRGGAWAQAASLLLPPDLPPGRYDIVQDIRAHPDGPIAADPPAIRIEVVAD